mmetsp:Transcript_62796/g.99520  ORF Transcript_62796/g.99520 Transcript_62796/m.99520 type:complete len:115 (+) Transcript_62796:50-394(+)
MGCQAGKSLACLHSKDEDAIGVVHLDTYPAESMSTDTGDAVLEEFEQVPEEDLVIRPVSEDVGPCVVGFPVSTVAEPVTVRVKDASSVVNAVPDIPRRTNCGRCAQCCVSVDCS